MTWPTSAIEAVAESSDDFVTTSEASTAFVASSLTGSMFDGLTVSKKRFFVKTEKIPLV